MKSNHFFLQETREGFSCLYKKKNHKILKPTETDTWTPIIMVT